MWCHLFFEATEASLELCNISRNEFSNFIKFAKWYCFQLWPSHDILQNINSNGEQWHLVSDNVSAIIYIYHDLWDEITYPFPNFNGCTVEVWEWISSFTPRFIIDAITYPCTLNFVNKGKRWKMMINRSRKSTIGTHAINTTKQIKTEKSASYITCCIFHSGIKAMQLLLGMAVGIHLFFVFKQWSASFPIMQQKLSSTKYIPCCHAVALVCPVSLKITSDKYCHPWQITGLYTLSSWK